ncbi:DUF3533 domain-containing protein [Nocardioides sp. NPDC126508]
MSNWRFALHPSTWLTPVAVLVMLGIALPGVYLGGTLDPQGNLENMPVALVIEKQTVDLGQDSAAKALADTITRSLDGDKFDLIRLDPTEERKRFDRGTIDGAIRIPADFDAQVSRLLDPRPGDAVTATVHLDTTQRVGAMTTGLFTGNTAPMLEGVRTAFGQDLAARTEGAHSTAEATALANPFSVHVAPLVPLEENTGLGTSVFYYAIVLVLLGFVGASAIHPLIDSSLGFIPHEVGPRVRRREYRPLSRMKTLAIKWACLCSAAPLAAAATETVAGPGLGMPVESPVELWLFSTLTIAAIGSAALTVFAIFGAFAPLVNMFLFVALAMTSSGGAVPLEATPSFFRMVASFETMRPIVEGLRSILYLGSTKGSGLGDSAFHLGVLLALALGLGAALTAAFDRVESFSRHPESAA